MKTSSTTTTWLLLLSSVCLVSLSQAQECDELNRNPSIVGDATCGECLDGFIEWQVPSDDVDEDPTFVCFNVNNLTLDDFRDAYKPAYVEDSAVSDDSRLDLLISAVQRLLQFRAANNNNDTEALAFELGITRFSADGEEEYAQRSGYKFIDVSGTENDLPLLTADEIKAADSTDLPEKVDWVEYGAVTSVKDQGRCGCCWATAVAGAVEGAAFIQNDYFQSMSFQQYISCNDLNAACDGGSIVVSMGYTWLNEFGGLATLNDYPYTDYRGNPTEECDVDSHPLAVEIAQPRIAFDYGRPVMTFDERLTLVKSILAEQPIAMVLKSSCWTLSMYRKGILTDDGDCECLDSSCADHAVLMVGYDDTSDPPSFTIKNSWGKSWGEKGYFRVSQQEKGQYGLFGILGHGVIPGTVTNTTAAVEDEKQKTPLKPWAIILIVLAGFVVIAVTSSVVVKMMGGGEKGGEEAAEEEKAVPDDA